jgi:hypothetical protein
MGGGVAYPLRHGDGNKVESSNEEKYLRGIVDMGR